MLNFNKKKYVSFDNLKSFNGLLQSSLKEKLDGYKSETDAKVQKKFNELSGKVQTDSEVIDARKGEASLRAKIDVIDENLKNVDSQLEHIISYNITDYADIIVPTSKTYRVGSKFKDLLNNISLNKQKSTITVPWGWYIFSEGITIDSAYINLDCKDCTFDFSSMVNGTAITITGTNKNMVFQATQMFKGASIQGNAVKTSEVVGLYLHTPKPENSTSIDDRSGTAHLTLEHLNIYNFGVGLKIGDNTYCNTFRNLNIFGCKYGVVYNHTTNSGERLVFENCTISNNYLAANIVTDCNISFQNCSFDYNEKQLNIEKGHVVICNNSNIEGDTYKIDYPIKCANDSSLLITDSNISIYPGEAGNSITYFFNSQDTRTRICVKNCSLRMPTLLSSQFLCNGNGKFFIEESNGTSNRTQWTGLPTKTKLENNIFEDYKFLQSLTRTKNYMFNSNPANTVTIDSVIGIGNGRSIKVVKNTTGNITFAVPVKNPNSRYYVKFNVYGSIGLDKKIRLELVGGKNYINDFKLFDSSDIFQSQTLIKTYNDGWDRYEYYIEDLKPYHQSLGIMFVLDGLNDTESFYIADIEIYEL